MTDAQTPPADAQIPQAAPADEKPKKTRKQAKGPKRAPARPHKRLALEVIDSRISKLQKRLDHAKAQIEDAGRHIEGYQKEKLLRAEEPEREAAPKGSE